MSMTMVTIEQIAPTKWVGWVEVGSPQCKRHHLQAETGYEIMALATAVMGFESAEDVRVKAERKPVGIHGGERDLTAQEDHAALPAYSTIAVARRELSPAMDSFLHATSEKIHDSSATAMPRRGRPPKNSAKGDE